MKRLIIGSLFTLLISIVIITTINHTKVTAPTTHQTTQKAHTEALETYSYTITKIDEKGIYGHSLTDDTSIFIDHKTVKNLSLHEDDKISVTFPLNNCEQITSVTKIE